MTTSSPKKLVRFSVISIVVLALIGFGLVKLRSATDGLKNAFSLNYWRNRSAGKDLYNANERYLKRGSRAHKSLLLTIDDGPHAGMTTILDILKAEKVPATFFVVGLRVKERPDLVRRMIDEGHEVGNHTQDHLRLTKLTNTQVYNEIHNCELNVQKATGRRMTFLRPPGMQFNDAVLAEVKKMGYVMIGWNAGAKDFISTGKVTDMNEEQMRQLSKLTPEIIVERVMKQLQNGVIILLHDNPITTKALPEIIRRAKAEGYDFKTSAEFLKELPNPVDVVANPVAASVASKNP